MEYLNVGFRLLAISQIGLFALFVLFSNNPKRLKVVCSMLMLGVISYSGMPVIQAYTPYYEHLRFLWFFGAIVPSSLLLFVFFIFEEQCELPHWMLALIVFSVVSSLYFHFASIGLPGSPLWLQLLKGLITIIAIGVVWLGREDDLVELRVKVRTICVLVLAIETLIIIFVEVITEFNPPLLIDTFTHGCIFIFTLAVNFFYSRLNPESQLMRPAVAASVTVEQAQDPVIVELLTKMKDERLYADHDLRVGTLAEVLRTPEYKLRQKINQELGYRNFNQFVNHYRIEEAGVKLREDNRTPVLTIALDVGFRSISSFNTAFQAHFGLSPTKYRAEAG